MCNFSVTHFIEEPCMSDDIKQTPKTIWKISTELDVYWFTTMIAKAIAAAPRSPPQETSHFWFNFKSNGNIKPNTTRGLTIKISITAITIAKNKFAKICAGVASSPKIKNSRIFIMLDTPSKKNVTSFFAINTWFPKIKPRI